jgi:hypothetical protein
MDITFMNPGVDYMIEQAMLFQTEDEASFWTEPLYYFYPQLDKTYAAALPLQKRRDYIASVLRNAYGELADSINEKTLLYTQHWRIHKDQITAALTDAFSVNCSSLFNDLRCNVSMNPVEPRFLKEHRFDIFYLNSPSGAIGESIHEIIHFLWFYVWNRLFGDRYEEYERPSLKWILSEMVVEPIMRDPRLSSINPYFPREEGGCIYPYFFDMKAGGSLVTDTMDAMYQKLPIEDFMKCSYAFCQSYEAEIRSHIQNAEH